MEFKARYNQAQSLVASVIYTLNRNSVIKCSIKSKNEGNVFINTAGLFACFSLATPPALTTQLSQECGKVIPPSSLRSRETTLYDWKWFKHRTKSSRTEQNSSLGTSSGTFITFSQTFENNNAENIAFFFVLVLSDSYTFSWESKQQASEEVKKRPVIPQPCIRGFGLIKLDLFNIKHPL